MGGGWSEEVAPELPQQVILQVDQGQPLEAQRAQLPRLGTTWQCQAVRPSVVLEGEPMLEADAVPGHKNENLACVTWISDV